jgi:hypothetical protein
MINLRAADLSDRKITLKGRDVASAFKFLYVGLRLAAVPADAEITTCLTEGKPHGVFMTIKSAPQALNEILNLLFQELPPFCISYWVPFYTNFTFSQYY